MIHIMTKESKTLKNVKQLIGQTNYWTHETLHENSSYNDLLFNYWHYFDGYPESTFLMPNALTSFTPIDRAIRQLPGRIKNISEQERLRKYYTN